MASIYKLLLPIVLVAVVNGQSLARRSKLSSSAGKTRYNSAVGEGRTLGFLSPLLRLGLGQPLRTGGALSDPVYGNQYGGYYGYPNYYNNYNSYSGYYPNNGYSNYGYNNGYRPPAAYPQYNGYTNPYQQQNYAGLNTLSPLTTTPNSPGGSFGSTSGLSSGSTSSTAQQAQLATVLGQALGSSLRPLLLGTSGGRYGTAAAAQTSGVGVGSALAGLLNLFG